MSIVGNTIAQLKRILFTFLGFIRRAFCCRRYFWKSNDSLLPVTIDRSYPDCPIKITNPLQTTFSNTSGQFSQYSQVNSGQWQSYDKLSSSFGNPQLRPANFVPSSQPVNHQNDQQEEVEEDYFKDMMPKVKRQKKIILRTNQDQSSNQQLQQLPSSDKFNFEPSKSSQFSMSNSVQVGGSWNEDDIEIEDTLREAREEERLRRLAEHQRCKEEKERKKSFNKRT